MSSICEYIKNYILINICLVCFLTGAIMTAYSAFYINLNSRANTINEQLFISGIIILCASLVMGLGVLLCYICDGTHSNEPKPTVKIISRKRSKSNSPLMKPLSYKGQPPPPLSSPPKEAFVSYKDSPILKIKRQSIG